MFKEQLVYGCATSLGRPLNISLSNEKQVKSISHASYPFRNSSFLVFPPLSPFHSYLTLSLSLLWPSYTSRVVTPLSSHSRRMENGDVARSPWTAEGSFSENGEWNFCSSMGGEWRMENDLGEGFTTGLCFSPKVASSTLQKVHDDDQLDLKSKRVNRA